MTKSVTLTTATLKAALMSLTVGLAGRGSIIEARSTIPILQCVRISNSAECVTIAGCDLDIFAETQIPGNGTHGFDVACDARALKKAISKTKAGIVEISDLGDCVSVQMGAATVKIEAHKAADFPTLPMTEAVSKFTLPAEHLEADLARLAPSISTEETRYYLNGLLFHVAELGGANNALRMAATDGHRLGVVERDLPGGAETLPDMLVPAKTVAFMSRLLKKGEGSVRFKCNASKTQIDVARWRITSKLIDGTFPDYTRVIPCSNDRAIEIDADAFADDLEAVSGHISGGRVGVALSAGNGWATVSAVCPENGRSGAVIESAAADPGDDLVFGANRDYLKTIMKAFAKCPVRMEYADARAPALFTSPETPEYRAVLMPMRLDSDPLTPEGVARLTATPLDALREQGPGVIRMIEGIDKTPGLRERAERDLHALIASAVEHLAEPGNRRSARLEVAAIVEAMLGIRGPATMESEREGFKGSFAVFAERSAVIEAARRERAAQYVPDEAEIETAALHQASVAEARARSFEGRVKAGQQREAALVARLEIAERRIARQAAVLAGRKAQLATVGQALAISQQRSAALTRQLASAGSSALALAAAETHAMDDAA